MTRRHLVLLKSARRSFLALDRHRDAWGDAPALNRLHPTLLARVRRMGDLISFHQQHPEQPDALPDEVLSLTRFLAETIDPAVARLPESSPLRADYRDARRVGTGIAPDGVSVPGAHDEPVDPEALRFEAALIREDTAPPCQLRLDLDDRSLDASPVSGRPHRSAAFPAEPAALDA
jgi:hypothetical protein